MTQERRTWRVILAVCLLLGALTGCVVVEDDHDDDDEGCFAFLEEEPNDTERDAQLLDDLFVDDCFLVDGDIAEPLDIDGYRVFVQEDLRLEVILDHSPFVDFDIELFDADTGELLRACASRAVPEVCAVSFAVLQHDIAVDVVIVSADGAGTYTLELNTH